MQPPKTEKISVLSIGFNKSYWESVRIALLQGLWFFPTSLEANLRGPLFGVFYSISIAILTIFLVMWHHSWLIVGGLAGYVVETEMEIPVEDQELSDDDQM
jgi:hypothetical protein